MRSLFARILLWFVMTTVITSIGLLITTAAGVNGAGGGLPPFARSMPFMLVEARYAYESGGVESLRAALQRMETVFEAKGTLTMARAATW